MEKLKARQKLRRTLRQKRNAVARKNLMAKQKASWTNLLAKQKVRLKNRTKNAPYIKDGKIVQGKTAKTVITKVKPKLEILPRLVNGKIVQKRKKKPVPDASRKASAKKGAKTAKKSQAVV